MSRTAKQRGAVLVELAIVVPFLLVLALGLIEIGLRAEKSQTIVAATRAGARVVSSAGDTRLADFDALQSISGALADVDAADVQRIIIYRADNTDGTMPTGCDASPQAGVCNHYSPADFALTPGDFTTSGTSCGGSAPDFLWCPLGRETDPSSDPDWIGVEIWVNHQSIAPLFVGDTVIRDRTIMRLEPRFS